MSRTKHNNKPRNTKYTTIPNKTTQKAHENRINNRKKQPKHRKAIEDITRGTKGNKSQERNQESAQKQASDNPTTTRVQVRGSTKAIQRQHIDKNRQSPKDKNRALRLFYQSRPVTTKK